MKSFPFRSIKVVDPETGNISYDRGIDANTYREMFNSLVSNGVLANPSTNLQVSATGSDMSILIAPGKGYVQGNVYWEDNQRKLILDAADSQPRIDRVVVRFNDDVDARKTDLYIVKGKPGSVPTPTELTRDTTKWELCLAEIYVNASVTSVSSSVITDKRKDKDLCGIVHGLIEQLDTTTLNKQYEAWLKDVIAQGDVKTEAMLNEFEQLVIDKQAQINQVLATKKFANTTNIEIETSNWQLVGDHYEIDVLVPDLLTNDNAIIAIAPTKDNVLFEQVSGAGIRPIEQTEGYITLSAAEVPPTFSLLVVIFY